MVSALSNLGVGNEPSKEVANGFEVFLCSLFAPKSCFLKGKTSEVDYCIFTQLRSDQGVEKLPPTL